MDTYRKIGVAIVMIIPTFVGSGALWDIFHSWAAVFIWVLVMAGVTWGLLKGTLFKNLAG